MPNPQVKRALQIVQAIGAAIKEAGDQGIPSGHLYAMLMGKISLDEYQGAISLLKRQGIVSESNHLLTFTA